MENNAQIISILAPLVGVIIGGLITIIANWIPILSKRKEEKIKVAQYLSFNLDAFAVACAEVVGDNEGNTGPYPSQTRGPEVPGVGSDLNASTLRRDLYTRFHEIKIAKILSDSYIRFYEGDQNDHNAAADQEADDCAKLGYDALMLARDIRRSAGIPEPNYNDIFQNFEGILKDRRDRVENKRKTESEG